MSGLAPKRVGVSHKTLQIAAMSNVAHEKNEKKVSSGARPKNSVGLGPGDKVYGEDGALLFHVNPEKVQKYRAQGLAAKQRMYPNPVPAPKITSKPKSDRTKKAVQKTADLSRRRRPVVKNDWGFTKREERMDKRIQELQKQIGRRRNTRRRRGRMTRSPHPTLDGISGPQDGGKVEIPEAKGESFWGGLLDSAIELAPHVIPLIAGMGDYTSESLADQVLPRTNSLAAAFSDGEMSSEVPAIHNIGSETRLSHREYIGDVYSTTSAFARVDFAVNPGMNETFPWASRTALNWEQYQMLGAMFVFESEASPITGSPGMGYVGLGSQYDVAEPVFTSKKQMFQSQFTVARKPTETFCHWIECNPEILVLPKKFIRGGPIPANTDLHLYDHCRTSLAVGGQLTPGAIIGELWLTYDVLITLPRSDETSAQSSLFSSYTSALGSVTQAAPLGATFAASSRNTFNLVVTGSTMTFPDHYPASDNYLWLFWQGTSAASAYNDISMATNTNCTVTKQYTVGLGGLGGTGLATLFLITTTGVNNAAVTFTTNSWIGPTGGGCLIEVNQIPRLAQESVIFDFGGRCAEARLEAFQQDQAVPQLVRFAVADDGSATVIPTSELRTSRTWALYSADVYLVGPVGAATNDDLVKISDDLGRFLISCDDKNFDSLCARVATTQI